ncbi:MAG: phasin family protein [Motiliproteus sp.]|nr:phasin family protein [Motiliproteus sp.]MCW9051910.1 phasin family protein [Motiliproteus sp.]
MFQDMTKTLNSSMGPMKELVEIQTKMLEKLTRLQMECAKNCVEATMHQTKELPTCHSAEEILSLQQTYAKELESTLRQTSSRNLEALNEAREEMERVTQDAFSAFAPKKEK